MQVFFYSSGDDQDAKRLEAVVHKVIPAGRIEAFKELDDFRKRLRSPVEPDSVLVLLASDREELQRMKPFCALLAEIYVILVLPDLEKGTIRIAHHLLPRFLSQKGRDFADLEAVLNRMYVNSQKCHGQEFPKEP